MTDIRHKAENFDALESKNIEAAVKLCFDLRNHQRRDFSLDSDLSELERGRLLKDFANFGLESVAAVAFIKSTVEMVDGLVTLGEEWGLDEFSYGIDIIRPTGRDSLGVCFSTTELRSGELTLPFSYVGLVYSLTSDPTKSEDIRDYLLSIRKNDLSLGSTALVGTTLSLLNGAHPYVDASNVVLSILATILMWQRFSEQWLCWILVNVTGIVMWTLNLLHGQGEGLPALLMWVAFLVNSVYGYYTWRRNALTRVYDAIA